MKTSGVIVLMVCACLAKVSMQAPAPPPTVYDQVSIIAGNVQEAVQEGDSESFSGKQGVIDSAESLLGDTLDLVEIINAKPAISDALETYNVDQSSISSVARSFEKLDADDQVDLIGDLLTIPINALDNAMNTLYYYSRKLLTTEPREA